MGNAESRLPTLREVQRRLAALVWHPERPEISATDEWLLPPPRGRTADRLKVYADGYPARIEGVLAETFPAVAHVIGPHALTHLTRRYVAAVPLRSYSINGAGAGFSGFLRDDPLTTSLPFLPDLAQLEWRVTEAFHAHQEPAFDPALLLGWRLEDWERAVLRFQPSVSIVPSDWPVRAIWEHRETPIEQIDIDVRPRPERVLIRRAGFKVACESLPAGEAATLAALLAGQSLGDVTALLAARDEDRVMISTCFARWARWGLITACRRRSQAICSGRTNRDIPGTRGLAGPG